MVSERVRGISTKHTDFAEVAHRRIYFTLGYCVYIFVDTDQNLNCANPDGDPHPIPHRSGSLLVLVYRRFGESRPIHEPKELTNHSAQWAEAGKGRSDLPILRGIGYRMSVP